MVAKSLEGDYRSEHLFALRQSVEAFQYYQSLLLRQTKKSNVSRMSLTLRPQPRPYCRSAPKHLRTSAPGMSQRRLIFEPSYTASSALISQTSLASAPSLHKRSCVRLAPMSHDSVMHPRSPPGLAYVRRRRSAVAACCTPRAAAYAADWRLPCVWLPIRCIMPKITLVSSFDGSLANSGNPQATTATAHKLARILYHLLSTKEEYNPAVFHMCEAEALRRAEARLRKQAAQFGFQIVPAATNG
jgi:transposase